MPAPRPPGVVLQRDVPDAGPKRQGDAESSEQERRGPHERGGEKRIRAAKRPAPQRGERSSRIIPGEVQHTGEEGERQGKHGEGE